MDEAARTGRPPVSSAGDRTAEDIRADIEQTRGDVGDTVEALAAKTDVKGQARQRVDELKGRLGRTREQLTSKARESTPDSAQQGGEQVVTKVKENPAPVAIGAAVLLAFLIGRRTGRR